MDPFTIAALLGAGASILSGFMGQSAAQNAASAQTKADNRATDLQAATIAQARLDAAPWLAAGQTALNAYMGELGLSKGTTTPGTAATAGTPAVYGKGGVVITPARAATAATPSSFTPFTSGFKTTPGYDFQVQQGEKAVNNNLAAQGLTGSGAALKALTSFRQGLANQTYNQYLDRLSGVSTGGQTIEGNNSALSVNSAANQANSIQAAGAATASGYVGGTNALTTGLTGATSGLTNAMGYKYGLGSW